MTEMQRQPGFPLRRTPQDEITAEPQGPPQDPELQRAQVRVVVPLSPAERVALQTYLERIVGRPVDLDVNLDATILGGVWIRMDDLVIDGSVRARLDALHERLCANCRIPEGAGPATNRNPA